MMQISTFTDGDPRVSWVISSRLLSPSPEPPTLLSRGLTVISFKLSSCINKPPTLRPALWSRRSKSIPPWRLSFFWLCFDLYAHYPPAALPIPENRLHTWQDNGGTNSWWQWGIALMLHYPSFVLIKLISSEVLLKEKSLQSGTSDLYRSVCIPLLFTVPSCCAAAVKAEDLLCDLQPPTPSQRYPRGNGAEGQVVGVIGLSEFLKKPVWSRFEAEKNSTMICCCTVLKAKMLTMKPQKLRWFVFLFAWLLMSVECSMNCWCVFKEVIAGQRG